MPATPWPALASVLLVVAAWQQWSGAAARSDEVLAFVTGAWTVWYAARNNPWTWPIGVANSAIFVILFWVSRLYFDMALTSSTS